MQLSCKRTGDWQHRDTCILSLTRENLTILLHTPSFMYISGSAPPSKKFRQHMVDAHFHGLDVRLAFYIYGHSFYFFVFIFLISNSDSWEYFLLPFNDRMSSRWFRIITYFQCLAYVAWIKCWCVEGSRDTLHPEWNMMRWRSFLFYSEICPYQTYKECLFLK